MKARIVDIENGEVTVKTEKGKFVTVPQKRFKFDCRVNDTIVVENNNGKLYFLPDAPSFWGDDEPESKPKKKKENKGKKFPLFTKVLVAVLIACLIMFAPVLISMNNERVKQEKIASLHDCLSAAENRETGSYEGLSEYEKTRMIYTNMVSKSNENITCYEKYGDENSGSAIEQNQGTIEFAKIQICLDDAYENYKVTDAERKDAGSDLDANMILVKRVGAGYAAQKDCYTKYGKLNDYSSEISELDAEIKENQSWIDYGKSAQEAQKYYSASRKSINCTTNTYGSSSYTNCY